MWDGWWRLRPHCTACGLQFDRGESDYFIGAYLFNLIAAELLFAIVFVVILIAMWPNPPWTLITWGGVAGALIAPVMLYPYTHATWLALDLLFRPGV